MISVVCRDASHYPHRLVKVGVFKRPRTSPDTWWLQKWWLARDRGITATVAGDELWHASRNDGPPPHYKLRCVLCGLNVSVRADRLHIVLDTLDKNSVPEIDLKRLAAIVVA